MGEGGWGSSAHSAWAGAGLLLGSCGHFHTAHRSDSLAGTPAQAQTYSPTPLLPAGAAVAPASLSSPSDPRLGAPESRLLAAQPPHPPGCEGEAGFGACGPECSPCCPRGCMRLGIRHGTGVCSLRPVVTPGPSLQSSKVQLRRPLSPLTGRGPDGAHDILFGFKTWRSKNP